MTKAETIRTGTLGKKALRLVKKDGRFFGLSDGIVFVLKGKTLMRFGASCTTTPVRGGFCIIRIEVETPLPTQ